MWVVEMLHGATVGEGGRISLQQGLARATLPPGVLTRSNLSPHSPLPPLNLNLFIPSAQWYSHTRFLHVTLHSLPLPSSLPPPLFGRRDRRWRYPARQWACTLRRSCRICSQGRASLKRLNPRRPQRQTKRRTMTQTTLRTTSYSPDAND